MEHTAFRQFHALSLQVINASKYLPNSERQSKSPCFSSRPRNAPSINKHAVPALYIRYTRQPAKNLKDQNKQCCKSTTFRLFGIQLSQTKRFAFCSSWPTAVPQLPDAHIVCEQRFLWPPMTVWDSTNPLSLLPFCWISSGTAIGRTMKHAQKGQSGRTHRQCLCPRFDRHSGRNQNLLFLANRLTSPRRTVP